MRWLTSRPDTTTSQASKSCLVALRRVAHADVRPGLGEEQHLARERLLGVDDDGQRLVVHEHELGGVDGFGSTLGDDDGDDVADEADDVAREERPPHPLVEPGNRRRLERAELDVRRGEDLRARAARSAAEASIPRMRACAYGRADEHRVERTRQLEVLDVEAVAAPGSASPRAGGSADPSSRSSAGVSLGVASHRDPERGCPADQIRGLLGDHHRRRVRVRARDRRHDGGVDDAQPLDPVDAQLGIDHRADRARRGRVVDRLAVRARPTPGCRRRSRRRER